jgi:hypothetical protein
MVYDASEMGIAMTTTGDQEASCLGSSRWLSVSVVSGTRKQRPTAACALSQDSDAWIFNMFQMQISRIFLVCPRWMSQAKAPGDATSGWQLFSGNRFVTLKRNLLPLSLLDVADNLLGCQGAALLASALESNTTLKSLNNLAEWTWPTGVSGSREMDMKGADDLSEMSAMSSALSRGSSVTRLDIGSNYLRGFKQSQNLFNL